MSAWSKHKTGECSKDTCYYCFIGPDEQNVQHWDGKCHGCESLIRQEQVAQIGPYWICDDCIKNHFPNDKYSVNQAADILEKLRGFS